MSDLERAIEALRGRGCVVEKSDFPPEPLPGLYYVDGRELTEAQVIDLARRQMITREQAIERLKQLQVSGDWESTHHDADEVLCDLLRELGYADVVVEWDKVGKWYA